MLIVLLVMILLFSVLTSIPYALALSGEKLMVVDILSRDQKTSLFSKLHDLTFKTTVRLRTVLLTVGLKKIFKR